MIGESREGQVWVAGHFWVVMLIMVNHSWHQIIIHCSNSITPARDYRQFYRTILDTYRMITLSVYTSSHVLLIVKYAIPENKMNIAWSEEPKSASNLQRFPTFVQGTAGIARPCLMEDAHDARVDHV